MSEASDLNLEPSFLRITVTLLAVNGKGACVFPFHLVPFCLTDQSWNMSPRKSIPITSKRGSFPGSAYTALQAALYIIHLATKQVARSPRKAIRAALSNTPTLLASWFSPPTHFGADLPPVPSLDPPRDTVCQCPSPHQPQPPSKLGGDSPACRVRERRLTPGTARAGRVAWIQHGPESPAAALRASCFRSQAKPGLKFVAAHSPQQLLFGIKNLPFSPFSQSATGTFHLLVSQTALWGYPFLTIMSL